MDKKLLEQLAARAEQKAKDRLEIKVFSVGGVDMQFHKPKQAAQLEYYGTLAEADGADVEVRSAPGNGTRVRVRFEPAD